MANNSDTHEPITEPPRAADKASTVAPWPEPVSTAELLDGLVEAIRRHVILSSDEACAVALWISHTWVFDRFDHTPRVAIRGPARQCGKSTLLDVLHSVCRQSVKADNITAAAMFRLIAARRPTLFLDEYDTYLKDKEDLRGVINSGFEKKGAVIRLGDARDGYPAQAFSTFAPVALAGIGSLPATIEDRSIPVLLKRKAAAETTLKLRAPGARATLHELACKAARWATDCGAFLSLEPSIPTALGDREGDICVPLLAIADDAGAPWPDKARASLVAIFHHRTAVDGNSEDATKLLGDIRAIFFGTSAKMMASAELLGHLTRDEGRPWAEWRNGKPMTAVQLAQMLAPFGIHPRTIRHGHGPTGTAKGYTREAFEDAWKRYLPGAASAPHPDRGDDPSQRHNAQVTEFSDKPEPTHTSSHDAAHGPSVPDVPDGVTDDVTGQPPRKPADFLGCDGVTDQSPRGERSGLMPLETEEDDPDQPGWEEDL